jgi:heme exporter protein C
MRRGAFVLLLAFGFAASLWQLRQGPETATIVFLYAPSAIAAMLAAALAVAGSVLYLRRKEMVLDALAVAATEAGLVFLSVNVVTGSIWDHAVHGIWWTWDPAVSSALVCGLVYASYLMLRRAIEEPSQRAAFCAVWSVFCFLDAPIATAAVYRWRARHPKPPLWAGVPDSWLWPLIWSTAGMIAVGLVMLEMRRREETMRRELDSVRRTLQVI